MDGGTWWAVVHGVARSQTRLSDFTLFFHFHALEKEMATHSSVLVWRISGTGEPGGLPSMGSHRVGHDLSNLAAAAAGISIRDSQESSPTPQFKSINSLALGFLYSPTLTSIPDYSKNDSFDYMDLCWQSNVSAF